VVDAANIAPATRPVIALGLRENWQQFTLLVLINAFVGGMVGLERTLMPLIGSETFQLASTVAVTSFIISFGVVKAITNLVSGQLADTWGRKKTLVLGWAVGLPVPFLIMWAPTWGWIVAANVLLGINQGLSWSMTVIMKVDLVGPRQRGLAVGLNEFAGYLAVGLTAFLTGYLATIYGLRPVPFYLGVGYAAAGLLLSALVVRDTREHVAVERSQHPRVETSLSFGEVLLRASLTDRNLFAASQAGLVNNLNDGMSWGIFPLFFAAAGMSVERIGILKGIYPAIWGILQVVTGPLSDRWGRKGADRRRNVGSGGWVVRDCRARRLQVVVARKRVARSGHCDGVSVPARGGIGRCRSHLACPRAQRLSVLARSRLRHRSPYCRPARRDRRVCLDDYGHRRADLHIGSHRGGADEGPAAMTD
jgi:MFS family permease